MTPARPIFLDHHSTTPCDPRVLEAMLPAFGAQFGNAASRQHAYGWEAEALVERAREQVAALIGAGPTEIVFTSGATESDNLAVKGAARANAAAGRHIVTCAIEHHAVLDSSKRLEAEGFRVTYLPVETDGVLSFDRFAGALADDTILVSIMAANNEIGTLQPIAEIGAECKRRGILFHCDAVQALGYLKCDVRALGIDLLSISAHKICGPKGVGALYVRRRDPRARLEPLFDGGGHERGLRSGTLNVPGIIGLGKACELAAVEREADAARVGALRDQLLAILRLEEPEAAVNGSLERRLPNNLNVSIPGVEADALLTALSGSVALSSGSACTSATLEPSYVLRALGLSPEAAARSIRIGLGRVTTAEEIERAGEAIAREAARLRR